MTLTFADETYVAWPMRFRWPHEIEEGMFIVYNGELMRIQTIQRDCPGWDSRKLFTSMVLIKDNGELLPTREVTGKFQTIEPKYRSKS